MADNNDDFGRWIKAQQAIATGQGQRSWRRESKMGLKGKVVGDALMLTAALALVGCLVAGMIAAFAALTGGF